MHFSWTELVVHKHTLLIELFAAGLVIRILRIAKRFAQPDSGHCDEI